MPDTPEAGRQEEVRLAKVAELRARGEEPFKAGFERTHTAADVAAAHAGLPPATETQDRASVAGRVMTIRRHGKLAFADVRDGSGRIQLFAQADRLGPRFQDFCDLDLGDWVGGWGDVVATRRGELSIRLDGFQLLTKCLRPWPEKWHGLKDVELRLRQRYLDLATNPEAREIVSARSAAVACMRSWLSERGFIEVETPMLHPIPGGALAKPFVTFHEALGMSLYLRIAPELYLKRLVIGGIERVFEINRNFRNEGVSFKHNPEFTMLELYQAFADYLDMADILEGLVRETAGTVCGSLRIPFQGAELDLESPFRRERLVDLVAELGVDPDADLAGTCERLGVPHDPAWPWGKLLLEIYEKKVEPALAQPTFVIDFPREISPLARPHRSDPRFTEHLDLVIGGMEIAPAYSELTDPIDQRARFEAQVKSADEEAAQVVDEDFLHALEYGMPPCGGLGLGVDRLVMLLTGSASIRDVILFPALRDQ